MSQHPGNPGNPGIPGNPGSSPLPPSISASPGGGGVPQPQYAVPPQVVYVAAKSGGLTRAILTMLGLFLFAGVFIIGLTLGIVIMIAGASYENVVLRETYRSGGASKVAIIPVEGVIDDAQAEFVHAAVKDVLSDSSIAAVVLRVDSPGGGVTASDQIWYEVKRMQDAGLPVVASYGSVAASGGYYVSCAADHIMAEETTITGSIGVIAQILTMEGLMDKVGVEPVTLVATGSPEKDVANNMFRSWNDADKAKIRAVLDAAYTTFNTRVRDGRQHVITDASQIDSVANGSIYTARQAQENGLIDSIGYLDDAIAQAETLGNVPAGRATVIRIRKPPTLFGDFMFAARQQRQPLDADQVRSFVNDLASPRVMYLMQ